MFREYVITTGRMLLARCAIPQNFPYNESLRLAPTATSPDIVIEGSRHHALSSKSFGSDLLLKRVIICIAKKAFVPDASSAMQNLMRIGDDSTSTIMIISMDNDTMQISNDNDTIQTKFSVLRAS